MCDLHSSHPGGVRQLPALRSNGHPADTFRRENEACEESLRKCGRRWLVLQMTCAAGLQHLMHREATTTQGTRLLPETGGSMESRGRRRSCGQRRRSESMLKGSGRGLKTVAGGLAPRADAVRR